MSWPRAGAPLVVETLAGLAAGTIHPQPQNHACATFAPLLDREDGRMDFAARTAHELYNRWRGFQPWPGAFTTLDGKKLIVHRMAVAPEPSSAESDPAGSVLASPGHLIVEDHRLFVALCRRYLARTPRTPARRQEASLRHRISARRNPRRQRKVRLSG